MYIRTYTRAIVFICFWYSYLRAAINFQFIFFCFIAITVNFIFVSYSVNENDGVVHPRLRLSNPSSFTETVQVLNDDVTAVGMLNYVASYICS